MSKKPENIDTSGSAIPGPNARSIPREEAIAMLILQLRAERDEAKAKYQFMVDRAADEKLDGYRELGARAADALNERDDALKERDEWKLKFHLSIDDALAARKERDAAQERMREFAAQKAHFMAERDAALARVRELEHCNGKLTDATTSLQARVREVEDCHERTKELCDVHCERIAALEAENAELRKSFRLACIAISNPDRIAENERLRVALDQPGLEDLGTLDLLAMLRAALKGEGNAR